jgi:hypothetical protein
MGAAWLKIGLRSKGVLQALETEVQKKMRRFDAAGTAVANPGAWRAFILSRGRNP